MLQRSVLTMLVLALAAAGQTTPNTTKTGTSSTAAQKKGPVTPAQTTTAGTTQPPTAIIHTSAGDLKCELFPDKAPKTVANFVGLATGTKEWTDPATGKKMRNRPLFDGVIFHRVIPGFMIQGGDPTGTGSGGPGYQFENETAPDLLYDHAGRLAMANAGPNTNGSQFFITEQPTPFLNGGYTIFGQCDNDAVALVKKIAQGPCQGGQLCNANNSRPVSPVRIEHIDILNAGKLGAAPKQTPAKPGTRKKKTGTTSAAPKS